jgi:hypothetical protein
MDRLNVPGLARNPIIQDIEFVKKLWMIYGSIANCFRSIKKDVAYF